MGDVILWYGQALYDLWDKVYGQINILPNFSLANFLILLWVIAMISKFIKAIILGDRDSITETTTINSEYGRITGATKSTVKTTGNGKKRVVHKEKL